MSIIRGSYRFQKKYKSKLRNEFYGAQEMQVRLRPCSLGALDLMRGAFRGSTSIFVGCFFFLVNVIIDCRSYECFINARCERSSAAAIHLNSMQLERTLGGLRHSSANIR